MRKHAVDQADRTIPLMAYTTRRGAGATPGAFANRTPLMDSFGMGPGARTVILGRGAVTGGGGGDAEDPSESPDACSAG